MTHDPRTLLDTYANTETEFGEPVGQVAVCAFDALRAVLDLHQPEEIEVMPEDPGADWTIRLSCTECSHYTGSDPWPCPTVQAITTALETS